MRRYSDKKRPSDVKRNETKTYSEEISIIKCWTWGHWILSWFDAWGSNGELAEEQAEQLAMFSALRNYHRLGDKLPVTEGMVQMLEKENEGKISQYEDSLVLFRIKQESIFKNPPF